jgi:ElaB/YqjD/DUF883 family membrane-anchored ribosome-binding protein
MKFSERMSRRSPESSEAMHEEIDALKSSLKDLRGDISDLLSHALGLGRGGAHAARDTAADAVEQFKAKFTDLRSRGEDQVAAFERQIEQRPLSAALIAFGAGFLAGMLLSRR